MPLSKEQIAQRIAQEVKDGFVVNLGIGIPTLVANAIPPSRRVMLQSENGLLGMGAFPKVSQVDPDLINAGKQTVTAVTGSSFFSSADSFAMIRGGHVNLTVLGAMQVDEAGNIANWMIPGKMVKGMGGAMDLVSGAQKVIVAMQHMDSKGQPKLLKKCTFPFTGLACIHHIATDYAYIDVEEGGGFLLREYAPDSSPEEVQKYTDAPLRFAKDIKPITV